MVFAYRLAAALAVSAPLAFAASAQGPARGAGQQAPAKAAVTIESANGGHGFTVELARTPAQQERGLMFRTNIPADGGMLFVPYPGDGGPPREASFWMKNTPTALDIVFIRANGTIARIAADAAPYSETNLKSGEPVAAVLELLAGTTAKLGIRAGDKVRWELPRR